jgi:CRISPR/Cas system-associated protein Cas10 (large subunit of type III CRISPR-Cas system)
MIKFTYNKKKKNSARIFIKFFNNNFFSIVYLMYRFKILYSNISIFIAPYYILLFPS